MFTHTDIILDSADGVQVLLDSVLAYDRWLRVRLA